MGRLFDHLSRRPPTAERLRASPFLRLAHSTRGDVRVIRDTWERWFAAFPESRQPEVRERFRDDDDVQHAGARFELIVHASLVALGYEVNDGPEVGRRRPDFLVSRPGTLPFIVEATVAHKDKASRTRDQNVQRLRDALDATRDDRFRLHLVVISAPVEPASVTAIVGEVRRWLSDDQVVAPARVGERCESSFVWRNDGWDLTIDKAVRVRERAGDEHIVASLAWGPWRVDSASRIAESVNDKAAKYRACELPLVVAVNVAGARPDAIDVMDALLGREAWARVESPSGAHMEFGGRTAVAPGFTASAWRKPDATPDRPLRNRSISAVWVCGDLGPVSAHACRTVLVHHPRATHPLRTDALPFPQLVPVVGEDRMEERPGRTVGDVLGLAPGWLGGSELA